MLPTMRVHYGAQAMLIHIYTTTHDDFVLVTQNIYMTVNVMRKLNEYQVVQGGWLCGVMLCQSGWGD